MWFAGDSFRLLFLLPPPGLASSFLLRRNFLEGACFPNNFAESSPLKKMRQHIFRQNITPPWASPSRPRMEI